MAVQILPNELVIAILDEAQYDDLLPRYKWLKRYCRVCHAWRPIAQRLLFAHVALLGGAAQCKIFKDAVTQSSTNLPHLVYLRESVRMLSMVVDHQEVYGELIELCPNLREIQLRVHHAFFRANVLSRIVRGPRVEALRLRTYHVRPMLQLLKIYEDSLRYLEVDYQGALQATPESLGLPLPALRLHELRYSCGYRETHAFPEWLLSGTSRETLQVLHIRCPSFQLGTLAVSGVGARLLSLATDATCADEDLSLLAPSLREFATESTRTSASALSRLPPGIIHISLRDVSEQPYRDIADGLATYHRRSDGSFRVLSYHRRRYAEKHDEMEDVRELYSFCEARGIEFRLFQPAYGHYAGERVPLGPVHSFPRPMPVSVRREMPDVHTLSVASQRNRSLIRRMVKAAGKAFGESIPAVVLAKP
ncbi:hypothetical protein BV20DRAFT_371072 [Pilatotrama ljubarskyi]|nr:hypothetical protein BV20DRAFT_371072 [Pilatotrama ljubarskyi]